MNPTDLSLFIAADNRATEFVKRLLSQSAMSDETRQLLTYLASIIIGVALAFLFNFNVVSNANVSPVGGLLLTGLGIAAGGNGASWLLDFLSAKTAAPVETVNPPPATSAQG